MAATSGNPDYFCLIRRFICRPAGSSAFLTMGLVESIKLQGTPHEISHTYCYRGNRRNRTGRLVPSAASDAGGSARLGTATGSNRMVRDAQEWARRSQAKQPTDSVHFRSAAVLGRTGSLVTGQARNRQEFPVRRRCRGCLTRVRLHSVGNL